MTYRTLHVQNVSSIDFFSGRITALNSYHPFLLQKKKKKKYENDYQNNCSQ